VPDTTLNLLTTITPIARPTPWYVRKLPLVLRMRLATTYWVHVVHAVGRTGQPFDVCTTQPPAPHAVSRTLTMPGDQAERLHEFFRRYYIEPESDPWWTPIHVVCAMLRTQGALRGKAVSIDHVKPGRPYVIERAEYIPRAFFYTLSGDADLCLTMNRPRGHLVLISPKAYYLGHNGGTVRELLTDADTADIPVGEETRGVMWYSPEETEPGREPSEIR
jgi:hypothetical protein